MTLGILKEIKPSENRVLLIPNDVATIVDAGHQLFVETGAGEYSGFSDKMYESAGALILPSSEKIFQNVELILKVQPPMPVEYDLYTEDHLSFSFLHLSNNSDLMSSLLQRGSIYFAAEMVTNINSHRSVLSAMSEIAGRMAVFNAAKYIEKEFGGKGILIGGAGDVEPANVTIIGAGVAGTAAARTAIAIGAHVTVMDSDERKLEVLRTHDMPQLSLYEFSRGLLREILLETDILIASVLVPGHKPPILVSRDDVKLMQAGSLVIDLSVDQGGCVETSRPTTFDNPTYLFEGIVHSAVTNLPSAVPFTASRALSAAALPYIMQIAQLGTHEAIALSPEIRSGLALYRGKIVNKDLAAQQKQEFYDILELLELNI
jgi:alanine dehydrogenase